jgi:hypothetical protein
MRDLIFYGEMSNQINNFHASQIPPAISTKGINVSKMPTAIFLASSTTSENVNIGQVV